MSKLLFTIFLILLFDIETTFGQSTGGWGICEFATKVDMDAFNPSSSNLNCKKVFVQATNEHYSWDGTSWVLDNANIYNTSDTLSAGRTVTMDGNNLTFEGNSDVQITSSGQLNFDNSTLVIQTSDSGAPDEGVVSTKKSMNFFTDADNNSTTDDFVWGTNGANVSAGAMEILMRLAGDGQLKLNQYGQASPNFNTGDEIYSLAVESGGDVVEVNNIKSSKVFYPPAMTLDASALVTSQTLDLHQQYSILYGTPMVGSTSAPSAIPTYAEDELYYYLTDYDTSILDNVSIDDNGVMTYDIIAVPSDNCVIVTVVFVVK